MKLAIIDGTGDFGDASYAASMRFSFCKQMADQTGAQPPKSATSAQYERGPSMEGYRVHERGERAADFLKAPAQRGGDGKLYLAGYSRGGSAAIMAAEILGKDKIDIEAMFLFDPVARHLSEGGVVVPANVKRVWIARRRLDPAVVAKYDHTIGPLFHSIGHNPFRVFFGGTATTCDASLASRVQEQSFLGTHGALGGVGWTHVSEDEPCQQKVAAWMTGAFHQMGLPIVLKSYPPSSKP